MAGTDSGIGIAPQDSQPPFQAFVEIDSSLERKYKSTGLGLSPVNKLVDLFGGAVSVESEPGKRSVSASDYRGRITPMPEPRRTTPIVCGGEANRLYGAPRNIRQAANMKRILSGNPVIPTQAGIR